MMLWRAKEDGFDRKTVSSMFLHQEGILIPDENINVFSQNCTYISMQRREGEDTEENTHEEDSSTIHLQPYCPANKLLCHFSHKLNVIATHIMHYPVVVRCIYDSSRRQEKEDPRPPFPQRRKKSRVCVVCVIMQGLYCAESAPKEEWNKPESVVVC